MDVGMRELCPKKGLYPKHRGCTPKRSCTSKRGCTPEHGLYSGAGLSHILGPAPITAPIPPMLFPATGPYPIRRTVPSKSRQRRHNPHPSHIQQWGRTLQSTQQRGPFPV